MQSTDFIGLLAGAFVLGTFSMQSMLWLRVFAVASNLCFIFYGLMVGLAPIWLLHALLLPLNTWRLAELFLQGRRRIKA